MAKQPKIYLTTPFMPVLWAATTKPAKPYREFNDKGEPNHPQYELQLNPTKGQVTAWVEQVKEAASKAGVTFNTKKPKFGISIAEDEEETVTIRAKSRFKPTVFDAKNNPLVDPKIGKGSVVRAQVLLNFYEKGVSLVLNKIQVKELKEWEGSDGSTPFDETDGYEAPEEARGFAKEEEEQDGESPLDL